VARSGAAYVRQEMEEAFREAAATVERPTVSLSTPRETVPRIGTYWLLRLWGGPTLSLLRTFVTFPQALANAVG
jgi:hypothetical protein